MAHGFRDLLGGGTKVDWATLGVRTRFLRGADNLYWEANHFKERYGMNTISCPSDSSWAAYYWAKNSTDPCRCAKRRHGVPRLCKGMCCIGERSRIYRLRAQALELKRLIRRGADLDGDDVALLSRALVRPT